MKLLTREEQIRRHKMNLVVREKLKDHQPPEMAKKSQMLRNIRRLPRH